MKNCKAEINFKILFLAVLTLPMFTKLNNYFLGAFLVLGLIQLISSREQRGRLRKVFIAWPVLSFFVLAVFACVRTFDWESLKSLERFWAFALVPLVVLPNSDYYSECRRQIFLALTYGTVAALLIGYGNVFYHMILEGETLSEIYNQRYIGFGFTEIIDSHPAYLGLFALVSIVFLLGDSQMPKLEKTPHILLLLLGLFQLAGRTALLLILVFLFLLMIRYIHRYRWQILTLLFGVLFVSTLFVRYGSTEMSQVLFNVEANADNNRPDRWAVSYDIFRESPVFGVGYIKVRELRKEFYDKRGVKVPQDGDYNAHNQFFEYLSTNGALGGFVFLMGMGYLIFASLIYRDLVFVFLFSAFLVCMMTESMLLRIKGVEFFALFASLFLSEITVNPVKALGIRWR